MNDFFDFQTAVIVAKIDLIFNDYDAATINLRKALAVANRGNVKPEYRAMIFRLLNWVRAAKAA